MDVYEAIKQRRSIRRFLQKPVPREALRRMLEGARLAPSGANMQPIRYIAVTNPALVEQIFQFIQLAVYLGGKGTPKEGERPTCYICVLGDKTVKTSGFDCDASAGIENILLAAIAEGLGTCWVGAIERDKITALLNVPDTQELHSVIAVGYPAQKSSVEEMADSVKYRLDENGDMIVPKRAFESIIDFLG